VVTAVDVVAWHGAGTAPTRMHDLSAYQFVTLWDDGELVVSRGRRAGTAPVLAMASAPGALTPRTLARLEHAYALRDELDAAWAARPLALVDRHGAPTLVCADPGGEVLARRLGQPRSLAARLRVAIGVTVALRHLHARRLIHKDLKPSNVLAADDGAVWLTGFGIASRTPRERPGVELPEVIAGTLAYMSPEQTGRMNRSIDSRSDLYALGVTLYELFTGGVLPFAAADAIGWIHCHVARAPTPLHVRAPAVPAPLSDLVMRLLAKPAEDRYQTAAGVEHDLRRALAELERSGRIDRFELAGHDASDRLLMPERLVGRDAEVAVLRSSFEQAVSHGPPRLVLVSGYAGIGKSSIVNELHRSLVTSRGRFAAGKFDQHKRDIPYATLAQAFGGLVAHMLGQGDAEIAEWRRRLLDRLGAHGQLLVQIVPELALVIGEPPPLPELPPKDAQARFHAAVRRFVAAFAAAEHPLVLFLDDLQWLDRATLSVIEHLFAAADLSHLLIVGAYRDNEVGPAHPLAHTLDRLRRDPARVREIVLEPLRRADVATLCAEAFRVEAAAVAPLAALVHAKTGGNPFFTFQFVTALVDEGLAQFDPARAAWQWDLEAIRTKGFTDNVADLMTMRLHRLPADARGAAAELACLGNRASLAVFRRVVDRDDDAIAAALEPAVTAGLVRCDASGYAFVHDRIQEAAYALIPEAARPAAHLRIGRALAADRAGLDDRVFEVVNHFNLGAARIETGAERDQVADLHRLAALRAKASAAHAAAHLYASRAHALLGPDRWDRDARRAFDAELLLGDCELLIGELDAAERRLDALRGRAETAADRAAVIYSMTVLYTAMANRTDRAIEICLDYLRRVGIDWPAHPSPEDVAAEYETLRHRIGARSFDELLALPLLADAVHGATIEVLLGLLTPAFNSDPNLVGLVLCRMANLSLEHGHAEASPLGFAFLAMTISCMFRDYRFGYQVGKLARDLVETRGLVTYRGRVYHTLGTHVLYWTQPLAAAEESLRQGLQAMRDSGDVTYVCFAYCGLAMLVVGAGRPLAELDALAEAGVTAARSIRFDMAEDMLVAEAWLARVLRGAPAEPCDVERRGFVGDLTRCWFLIRRLQACVVLGDFAAAVDVARRIEPLVPMQAVFFNVVEYHFYAALARAALAPMPGQPRAEHAAALAAHRRELAVLAAVGGDNLTARLDLVDAELARVEGDPLVAMDRYERAIDTARTHGGLQVAALACEAAARFYAGRGLRLAADACAAAARSAYLRWGATAKVRQLDGGAPPAPPRATQLEIESASTALDLATVVKSSRAVTAEVGLDRLVQTLMTLALEHAGADRGVLVLADRGDLQLAAEASVGAGAELVVHRRRGPARYPDVPESIANYVARTQGLVLVPDAAVAGQFSGDPYLRARGPRAAVCLPLVKQSALVGMLYLENTLTANVFTTARIAVLELLAAQAATALQNASLAAENAVLAEKEALLKEVHHRVKNNLQLVSSLLSLQASRVADPEVAALFADSRNRVRSMALVHENLYRAGDLARIPMALHVRTLLDHLRRAHGVDPEHVVIESRVGDVELEMHRAVTLGLIINELVSNALKHAFPGGGRGRIWIELDGDAAVSTLVVGDDGVGLPPGTGVDGAATLGLQLIGDLASQLHGTVTIGPGPGTRVAIGFPATDDRRG
jgi:predicted ATPase/two-component sensor histidine kinase